MRPNSELEPLTGLPPELADLDAELSRFQAEERSSFAPELEAELEREWIRGPRWSLGERARRAAAAAVIGLTLTGLAVPPARASIVDGLQRLIGALQDVEEPVAPPAEVAVPVPTLSTPVAEPGVQPIPVSRPTPVGSNAEVEADELPAFRATSVTYPTLVDEDADQELIRRHYPPDLQRAGVGGTVRLLLWVAEDGSVDNVQTQSNSGVPALDRAAMQGVRSLRFNPATRDGRPVGTYVEFDLVFEPQEPDWVPPEVIAVGAPEVPMDFAYEIPEEGPLKVSIPAPIQMEARDLLSAALGAPESEVEARLGSLEGLLAGDPPNGVSPLRWRSQAGDALERAMARDPDNPAPALALARIRMKQGLRDDARALLGRGLEGAERGTRTISPRLVAELNYEMGRLVRESWLSVANLGEIPEEALAGVACTRRGSAPVGVETLLAWNYVCPVRLGEVMASSFVPSERGEDERSAMLERFRAAVESFPGHVGANTAILLDIADRELWLDLLNGARRFAWDTQGHPYGFLMSGLALQRLGRAEEALEDFEQAFVVLGADTESAFRDVSGLGVREDDADAVWSGLDPILQTEVNEREVEHLARAAYAYLRFGDLTSDAARLWLRYGRPMTVRAFGLADLRTEFWDYGQGPDVTLSRPATSDHRSLTPEGEAYVEELSGVFPHWYGTRARPLYSLPAQAARFRGLEPGTGEIEVQLDVPPALETFESDSLDIGLFLLAADGSATSATTRRIAGDNVRLRTAAGADVAGVVVELYNSRTHEAAALRLPAFRGVEVGEDPRVSDLWLVEAAAPAEREVSRTDRWIRPLPRPDVVDDDQVGVVFELYDLPLDEGRFYRIAVELISEATGEVLALPYRPSGQDLFGTEWTRSAAGYPGGSTEYVTVDLSGARPGVYGLRVSAELAGGETVSTSLSGVRLRVARDDAVEDEEAVGLMSGIEMY